MTGSMQKIGLSVLLLFVSFLLYNGTSSHTRLPGEEGLIWKNPAVAEGKVTQAISGRWEAGSMFQPWEKGEFRPQVRPIPTLFRAVEHSIHDFARGSYQIDQVLLHGLAGVLLFLLLARWLGSILVGVLGGLLFVAHPAATHSVLHLGGLSEILCTIFFLATFLAIKEGGERLSRSRLIAIGLLAFVAMLSKEVGFLLPLVALGLLVDKRPGREGDRRALLAILVATVVAGLYWIIATMLTPEAISRIPAVQTTSGLAIFPLILQSIAGILVEASVLVLPLRLSHDYSWLLLLNGVQLYMLAAMAVALVAGVLVLAFSRGGNQPRTSLALAAILPLLAPAVIPGIVGTAGSERNIYLALPGWIGLALMLGQVVTSKWSGARPVLAGLAVGIVLALGLRTTHRVDDFQSHDALLESAYRNYERNPQILFELGNKRLARADYQGAIQLYEQALELRPDFPLASVNLGNAYIGMEEWGLALRALTPAASRSMHVRALRMIDAKTHYAAGRIMMEQERHREAALAFERVLLFYPEHLGAMGNLGLIYVRAPHYVYRGIELLEFVIARETNPNRKAGLQKGLTSARNLIADYTEELGVPPSERDRPEDGAIGVPWKEAEEEGM